MKKQKKQSILNTTITILVLILILMIGSIIYEEKININKQTTQNTSIPIHKEENVESDEELKEPIIDETPKNEEIEEQPVIEEKEEYIGEEESQPQEKTEKTIDEKVIELVKDEYGETEGVTFSIVKKKGTKYYVAVKSNNTQNIWYEVDTETWEVSEY
jgi:hypothetical protein